MISLKSVIILNNLSLKCLFCTWFFSNLILISSYKTYVKLNYAFLIENQDLGLFQMCTLKIWIFYMETITMNCLTVHFPSPSHLKLWQNFLGGKYNTVFIIHNSLYIFIVSSNGILLTHLLHYFKNNFLQARHCTRNWG